MDKPSQGRNKGGLNALSAAGIGIGGIIGAGFFLGSSLAIRQAGPSVVVAYLLGGLIMSQVLSAMMSISMNRPVEGSFRVHVEQMLGRFAGYILGWSVYTSGILAISSEAVAAGIFIRYWLPGIPLPLLTIPVLLAAIFVNMLNARFFSYVETGMALFKITVLALFIVAGGVFLLSGSAQTSPNTPLQSGVLFPNGLTGLMQSMLIVIFTYSGISAVAMAAPKIRNRERGIIKANVMVVVGVILLYSLSVWIVVSAIHWGDVNNEISPFVQAVDVFGLGQTAAVLNAAILVSTLSVMAATYYNSMRIVASLSRSQMAPPPLEKRSGDRGFLKSAWLLTGSACLIATAFSFAVGTKLFNYLVSASSYVTFMNWIINLFTYLSWLRKRGPNETARSPLVLGKVGVSSTLFAISTLFAYSLTVADFRVGFAIFVCIILFFGLVYAFSRNVKRK